MGKMHVNPERSIVSRCSSSLSFSLSRNGKWNGTRGRLHRTRCRYIYIYTHVKVVSSDGKNLAQKWNWELVNYAEYSIETFDGGCGNTWRIFPLNFSLRLNLKRQNSRILLIYRRIRTWADFICFCLNERQGSWIEIQLFVDDKTRLEELSCGMI